ncbi:hypothetical protein H181DRAFT_01091 [Streptomyces sp. WMMB 714]|uniref:hypothetical protein n=1 Tax=Streptomyces sp. WMMB 714 TaxID=1286822 RepID=UPI0005F772B0|nr:hypothetical protein [Streptomyces sp. WMMB 714]SCK16011.1 hypothetical protein H181DRAFT_01091 [Streptomyces sp. WMMB 714]
MKVPSHRRSTLRAAVGSAFLALLTAVTLTLTPGVASADTAQQQTGNADAEAGIVVNGHQLTAPEEANVRWIAENTVPRLDGDRASRVTAAARVTWWSLKEGILGLENPHTYSNCDNVRLGPLDSCEPSCCWQVGNSAVQVTTFDQARIEEVAQQLYPGESVDQILAHTADYAGFPEGSAENEQVVNSTGLFRTSWLLRNHGVGFALNAPQVKAECIDDSLHWCYGTGWDTTAKYAPDKASAMGAIDDLYAALDQLAP